MTVFVLKIIAIISMILDHLKYAVPATKGFATLYFGRIAFPIFAFLISEGFVHTHSRPKYLFRMLIFAIISQLPFHLFAHQLVHSKAILNVMFTFEIALCGLYIIDFFKKNDGISKFLDYIIIVASLIIILSITYYIHPDYTWYGVSCVWLFYIFRKSKILKAISFIVIDIFYYLSIGLVVKSDYKIILFSLIPIILILFYNGKQGRNLKYFFYFFYPVHMFILYFIGIY